MFPITSIRIVYRAMRKWSENGGTRMGAALAYYALFSIAPLLLIAVHIAGSVFGEDAAKDKVRDQLDTLMPKQVGDGVEMFFNTASQPKETFWTPTISILILMVGALGAFLHVRGTLCTIWKLEPPAGNSWLGMVWDYVLSLIMVFITATMLLVTLACGLIVPIVQKIMKDNIVDTQNYWHWFELGGSFIFLTFIFAASYRILSGGRIPWGYVWYGSLIAAVMFTIGKALLSYYILYTDPASMYGAAGSVVVFLMWVYYSSQILFFGAELIQARRTRYEWLYGQKTEA